MLCIFARAVSPGDELMSLGRPTQGARVASLDRPLIVHSHVRWDFLWQRPQQILSRLAMYAPVLVIEEPVFHIERVMARLELSSPAPNVTRAVPHLSATLESQVDRALDMVRSLTHAAIGPGGALEGRFESPVQWFYTPAPAPVMLGAFDEVGIVYEYMEEPSRHRFSPPSMEQRERMLLGQADLVLTNGTRLFQAKSQMHENVHLVGCGVDAVHFGRARLAGLGMPADIASLPAPVVGYVGVIDDRIDLELLGAIADARPDLTVAMVGPLVNGIEQRIPTRGNITWLGAKSYDELPAYVKAFSVCMIPFAVSEATDHINPTTALEYMAAGKPVVSTPIRDVVGALGSVVRVAATRDEFIGAIGASIAAPDVVALARGLDLARRSSWESITERMRQLLREAVFAELPGAKMTREIAREWSRAPLDVSPLELADGELTA
jgi:glycosyltransferase involved in cell wall biosynthesis